MKHISPKKIFGLATQLLKMRLRLLKHFATIRLMSSRWIPCLLLEANRWFNQIQR